VIQALWDVVLCQLAIGGFANEIIAYIHSAEQLENNGFSFIKIGNICLFNNF
jgi:hypothetical protein